MSETPQETLRGWLDSGSWIGSDRHSIREAIRAVLAENAEMYGILNSSEILKGQVQLRAERDALKARVEAVLALHVEHPAKTGRCNTCDLIWPCPTRRALEGEP